MDEFKFTTIHRSIGYEHKFAILEKTNGEWPSDTVLMSLVDGDEPGVVRHFGGVVHNESLNRKSVKVYTG